MNILKSHASDKLLQLIFYSQKPKRKEGHPICREGKYQQGKTLPGTSPPKIAEDGTSEKMERKEPLQRAEKEYI